MARPRKQDFIAAGDEVSWQRDAHLNDYVPPNAKREQGRVMSVDYPHSLALVEPEFGRPLYLYTGRLRVVRIGQSRRAHAHLRRLHG